MKITRDYVPFNLHMMLDLIGNDKFLEICKIYGGSTIYIPVYRKVIMGDRNKQLLKEFNGSNLETLRFKYKLSEQQIKRVIYDGEGKYE